MMIVCARQYSESESESVSSYACPIFNAGGGFGCGIPKWRGNARGHATPPPPSPHDYEGNRIDHGGDRRQERSSQIDGNTGGGNSCACRVGRSGSYLL
ncbi:hypothetical protein ACHAW5_006206 [Stephanodiscus triporus]|uniref:Uncharacterized protein n=1 Tax=Stephanodiscus triporus TaxID=2934178 RepID=A0ABD3MVP0_9STRA